MTMSPKTDKKYYKLCTHCNFFCNVVEPDEFCSLCGSELIDMCQECGNKIDNPYARYCKVCGGNYLKQENKPEDEREF